MLGKLLGGGAERRTVPSVPTWNSRARIAALTAVALAIVMLMLTIRWDNVLLMAAGVLTIALVGVATTRTLPAGSCPTCQARPRQQQRTVIGCQVEKETPETELVWVVLATVDRLCTNCRESRRLVEEVVVPRTEASTSAEAVVLAMNESYSPTRIHTSSAN
jgi:hypothetical protein